MKRSSIGTTTTLSTNTKTTSLETDIKNSLKIDKLIQNQSQKISNSYHKSFINLKDSFDDFSSNNDFKSKRNSKGAEKDNSLSKDSNSEKKENSTKKSLPIISSINRHKKISNLPYYLKNKENLKLKYINQCIKSTKFPKYSSDFRGLKLKKDLNFENMKIFSKKSKVNYILSDQKKFKQRRIFLNNDNNLISFGLYYDKDIIDKSKELNKELIENDFDMDDDSDEEGIQSGIDTCLYDIKRTFEEIKKYKNTFEYINGKYKKLMKENEC